MLIIPKVMAQNVPTIIVEKPPNFLITSIPELITSLIGLALTVAGIIVFVYLVWGGLEWIMGGGDKTRIESARSRITNALIGLAIVASSWAVMLLVSHFFGIPIFGQSVEIPIPY